MKSDLEAYLSAFEERDWEHDVDGTVRFALLGVGWWVTEHAIPAIESTEHCETTALVSSSEAKAKRVGSAHGIETALTYEEFKDGVGTETYDAAYVCTPNATHLELVEAAAAHDTPVLCEKPMEATVERARSLREACRSADVPLMVAYRMQTEPVVRRAREFIAAGGIGEPVLARGTNSQRVLSIAGPDQWRLNADLTGYGTSMMDIGIYPLNTARFLLEADPVAATATMNTSHQEFADVPDERAACTVEFEGGVPMTITTSQHAHTDSSIEIVGTEGSLELEPAFHLECDIEVETDDGAVDLDVPQVDEMAEEFAYFADRLLADAPIGPDGDHGLVDMEALAACYESAESGRRVALSDV